MPSLFTSSKKRLEQRMLKQCLNTEKPEALAVVNTLGRPAGLAQPVAKLDGADPVVLNVLRKPDGAAGVAPGQALFVTRKTRR